MLVKSRRNGLRTMVSGLLCAALLCLGAPVEARTVQAKVWSEAGQQGAMVFEEPRDDAEHLGTIADGDLVDVVDETGNGWYMIQWTGESNKDTSTAYVRQDDLLLLVQGWEEGFQSLVAPEDGNPMQLYQRPDADSRVLGIYYPGNEVIASSSEWDWTFVTLRGGTWYGEGISGYMRTDGLQLETYGSDVEISFGELRGEGPVSILRKPDTAAQVLGPVEPGAQVRVMGESGDYLHISAGCYTGYVPREQVEILPETYSHDIPLLSEGRAFAVVRGDPGSALQAYPFCEEKETGEELVLPSGSGLWVVRELGEWTQIRWSHNPDMFVRAEWLDFYPAPSVFSNEEASPLSLGTGTYTVGEDLPEDAYCFRVPEGKQGTLEVSWPEGEVRQHTPVPGTIYNMYLLAGVSVTISGDGALEPVDKTWIRSQTTWEFPPNATGRYISGLNMEHGFVLITLAEGETEGYYRLHRISQEAGEGEQGEMVPLVPGVEQILELEYGDILEIVNGRIWTNG